MPTIIDIVPVKSPTTGTRHTISSTITSTTPNSAGVRYAARRYCWLTHTGTIARSPILYSLQDEAPSTQCGPMVYITSVIPFACVDYSSRRCEGTTNSVLPTAQVFTPPLSPHATCATVRLPLPLPPASFLDRFAQFFCWLDLTGS